ncbi:MAG: APC family permease [Stackebrandtia sp.]
MPSRSSTVKRLLLGRPFRSDRGADSAMPKWRALPVYGADPMSSVAYAPEQIFLVLGLAGAGAYAFSGWTGLAIAIMLAVVVASYRLNLRAYTSGGDFETASANHGDGAGLVVAGALLVDYVLTVAVSMSAAAANVGSALPYVAEHKTGFAVAGVALLAVVNLRGIRAWSTWFVLATYAFVLGMAALLLFGAYRIYVAGDDVRAESAAFTLSESESALTGAALMMLVLRAFSSGSVALTGIQAAAAGVPAFRPPRGKNAATTLLLMGALSTAMFLGLVALAKASGVKMAADPAAQLIGAPDDYRQKTMLAQLAEAVFGGVGFGFAFLVAAAALILIMAANTAFNGFPALGSILAQARFLPRQLHTRGDKLVYSNGVGFLALFASGLIVAFGADEWRLIQLYIVGVFMSFVLSQSGMVRHWTRLLRTESDPAARRRARGARIVNAVGFAMTAVVLVVVVVSKFTHGAWISLAAIAATCVLMAAIRRYYDKVAAELEPSEVRPALPSRNHVIVLASRVHRPLMRALAYARATRPDSLTALTVNVDAEDTRRLQDEWQRRKIPVPLTVIDSPYREITGPIIDYVKSVRRESPREMVTVFIPEYVVGHWWENLLHNQSALRIKSRLRFEKGVMVASVPWQLASSGQRDLDKLDDRLAGK